MIAFEFWRDIISKMNRKKQSKSAPMAPRSALMRKQPFVLPIKKIIQPKFKLTRYKPRQHHAKKRIQASLLRG